MGRLSLGERLDALAQALRAGRDVLPESLVHALQDVEERSGHRLRLSAEHTVVALAGSTGSGKSSLLNALAGEDLARTGVLRPTTSEALAVVRRSEGAGELLDWLAVRDRHVLPAGDAPAPTGLVLLDLPDHDSVVTDHRLEAERLVALVDLMVWVVDPQKYADALVHERYLRNLTEHREVLLVVLNQVDRLAPDEVVACHRDLARLLAEDGLAGVPVLDVSARTGQGVDALRRALDDAARRREAAQARAAADITTVARQVLDACGDATPPGRDDARPELVAALERAARVPVVVDAVRTSWVLRARRATGWPVTRWLARLRPDPVRRLHLDAGVDPETVRTSLPPTGPAEAARARGAVRTYVDRRTAGLPEPWALAAREATTPDLEDPLDRAVGSAPVVTARRPVWWSVVSALQWLLLAVLVAGVLWLGGLWLLDGLRVPVPDPPRWGEIPWPTLAAVGGALAGVLLALLARGLAALGARRQARRATARLRSAVTDVALEHVVEPVEEVLHRHRTCREDARRAAGA